MEIRQILKEEINKVLVSEQDKKILHELLGNNQLNEAVDFPALLNKVKAYASKGAITASVLAGLMSSPAFSQQQKQQIKAVAQTTQVSAPKQMLNITPQLRMEWNNFIQWIANSYPGGISDQGADPTAEIVAAYQKVNPKTAITAQNIHEFQEDLQQYNEKWRTLQINYHPQGTTLSTASQIDNRIGSITSKQEYPLVAFEYRGRQTNFGTDIDSAVKAFAEEQDNKPYVDPNLTPDQRLQRNQQLRAQGKSIPTVGDMKRASISANAAQKVQPNTLAANK